MEKKDARLKIVFLFAAVLTINLVSAVPLLVPLALLTGCGLIYLCFQGKVAVKSIAAVILFALFMALMQAMTVGVSRWFSINIFGIPLGIFHEGVAKGLVSFLRITGSMGMIILLFSTMDINEFIWALRKFRLPKAFIEVLMFSVKFIYIFKEEASTIRKAQRSRLGYSGFGRSVRSASDIAGIMLCRAYDKSDTLVKSMKSRGYDGENVHITRDKPLHEKGKR